MSLAQPFDRFDEAGLFYRTVLGLVDEGGAGEFAAPFGLIRTLSLADPGSGGPGSRSVCRCCAGATRRPAVAHPQHITLATGDIERTAGRAPGGRGGRCCAIPDNYYDDLDARLDLATGGRASGCAQSNGPVRARTAHGAVPPAVSTPVFGSPDLLRGSPSGSVATAGTAW